MARHTTRQDSESKTAGKREYNIIPRPVFHPNRGIAVGRSASRKHLFEEPGTREPG